MPGTDERKPVTVLFADLAGSTDLATRHDAEALRALLSAFFEEMRHHIEAFGEQGAAHRALGDALAAAGRRVEAEASCGRSLQTLESIQSLPESGQTLLALGRFKLADDRAEGRRLVERARAIFDEIGATGWSREAETVLASVA
jgi:class 3 adenylate cyclase